MTMRLFLVGLALLAIASIFVFPQLPYPTQTQLQAFYFDNFVKGDEGEQGLESIEARLIIWSRAFEVISDRPLTGVGMNIFRTMANEPVPILPRDQAIPHAHNWSLQIWLELGLPGLIFYMWLVLQAMWHLVQVDRLHRQPNPLLVGYWGAIIAFMVFGLLDTISPGARPEFIFWLMLAGAFAIRPEPVAESL